MSDNIKKLESSDSEEEGEIRLSDLEHPSLQVRFAWFLISETAPKTSSNQACFF